MRGRDDGTVIPLLVLGFLLAGTLLTASVAGSAALVAHRRLAADCDGAALAGASALDRTALNAALPPAGGPGAAAATGEPGTAEPGEPGTADAGNPAVAQGLPLDGTAAAHAARAHLAVAAPGTTATIRTDRTTVTVVCARTVRVPFGAVIARPHGIRETATARAGTVVRPST
jgi:hypothetical protein